jgi:hypothetical protein
MRSYGSFALLMWSFAVYRPSHPVAVGLWAYMPSMMILAHQISSEGEEGDQEEERNPNIDAHQPRLL